MEFDLVIANGIVIDYISRSCFRVDRGIHDSKIATVTTGESLTYHVH